MPDVCHSSTLLNIVVRFSCKVIIIFWRQDGHFILYIKYAHARTDTFYPLWPRLKRYVDDGRFNIDNNLIENSIRPVALGRKNYLFAGSHEGAKNAAVIYSLLATCKLNNIEPFEWLKEALETIPDYPANQLHKLIPGQK